MDCEAALVAVSTHAQYYARCALRDEAARLTLQLVKMT